MQKKGSRLNKEKVVILKKSTVLGKPLDNLVCLEYLQDVSSLKYVESECTKDTAEIYAKETSYLLAQVRWLVANPEVLLF